MGSRDDEFWSGFLGVEATAWSTSGVSFAEHAGLCGYRGFWCFRRNDRVIVSAPPRWVSRVEQLFAGWDLDELMDATSLANALGDDFERAIGPAFQGCLDSRRFTKTSSTSVRALKPDDAPAVRHFQSECAEWEGSGLDEATMGHHASFEGEQICAMAAYRPWNEYAVDPCILTHPHYRGAGRGAAVTSAVVEEALARGKLLLYQTLESNIAAVRIALSLGYERYANHVAVRLRREAPES